MRVLVTGGAGYIGSISVRALLDAGHDVVVLDSLERGHAAAVDPRAELVRASVGDADVLTKVLLGTDVVLHVAGYIEVAESELKPGLYYRKNVDEPSVMLEAMLRLGVKQIVFSSTAAVYGEPDTVPIPETAPVRPINVYGATKLSFERMIEAAEAEGALTAVRLRYFNVAGAWPDGSLGEAHQPESHIVPRLLAAAAEDGARFSVYGDDYPTPDGTCVRDYIHVLDLAAAHVAAVEHVAGGGVGVVCNLGSGTGYSNLEVVRACAVAVGRDIPIGIGPRRPGDPAVLVAAIDRAREVLGWQPARDLATMVGDAWRWHQAHPDGYGARP
jgi:UDP-glucose 4-epimerase